MEPKFICVEFVDFFWVFYESKYGNVKDFRRNTYEYLHPPIFKENLIKNENKKRNRN